MDVLILRHDCFKIDGNAYCERQRCSPRSVVSGDISLSLCRYSLEFAGEMVSNVSAVIENASFLFRSL